MKVFLTSGNTVLHTHQPPKRRSHLLSVNCPKHYRYEVVEGNDWVIRRHQRFTMFLMPLRVCLRAITAHFNLKKISLLSISPTIPKKVSSQPSKSILK